MRECLKIVALVPVKDEAMVLDRFLQVTSAFAGHILVADQASGDRSAGISGRYPKVRVFPNASGEYSESQRRGFLACRRRLRKGRVSDFLLESGLVKP